MRLLAVLMIMFCSFVTFSQQVAYAGPGSWAWWSSNWKNLEFKPYLGDERFVQPSLWEGDRKWTPEQWAKDAGSEQRIMRDFYATGIISDQYIDSDNIPVLVVGRKFMSLSGVDKRRVLDFVDYIFKITKNEKNGMFYVYYSELDDDPIGVYNKFGFQQY